MTRPTPPRRGSLVSRMRAAGGIVVAAASTKGGSGKSMCTWNLAHEYAQRGARVLLVDTDPQQTLVDAARVRDIPARVTVQPYPHRSIWEDLETMRAGYDVAVIDAHGRHDEITRAVVVAAAAARHGVILIPCGASAADIWATRRDTAPILAAAAAAVPWQVRARVVLSRYDPRESMTEASAEALAAAELAPIAGAGLRRRTVYNLAQNVGQAVCEYEPNGAAAAEVAALATEIARLALTEPQQKEGTEQ